MRKLSMKQLLNNEYSQICRKAFVEGAGKTLGSIMVIFIGLGIVKLVDDANVIGKKKKTTRKETEKENNNADD